MHSSYGPQVGSSSSARFNYEDPILRSITDLSNRISTLGAQQQQMQDSMAHNTQLTQESWGLTSTLQYDVSNVFIHLGLDYQQSQPYQPYCWHLPTSPAMTPADVNLGWQYFMNHK